MAAVMSSPPIIRRPVCRACRAPASTQSPPRASAVPGGGGRRHCLFLLTATATAALKAIELPSAAAQDIPLFGLRKKIQKAEEAVEEVVIEGIQAAEKGLEAAEKQIETAEKQIDAAEAAALTVDAAVQAAAVAGTEVLGVVVATSIVNGILASDSKKKS